MCDAVCHVVPEIGNVPVDASPWQGVALCGAAAPSGRRRSGEHAHARGMTALRFYHSLRVRGGIGWSSVAGRVLRRRRALVTEYPRRVVQSWLTAHAHG